MTEKMTGKQALKRLKQETCPATYNPDFDKNECIKIISNKLTLLEILEPRIQIYTGQIKNDDGVNVDVLFFNAGGFVLANSKESEFIKKYFNI